MIDKSVDKQFGQLLWFERVIAVQQLRLLNPVDGSLLGHKFPLGGREDNLLKL